MVTACTVHVFQQIDKTAFWHHSLFVCVSNDTIQSDYFAKCHKPMVFEVQTKCFLWSRNSNFFLNITYISFTFRSNKCCFIHAMKLSQISEICALTSLTKYLDAKSRLIVTTFTNAVSCVQVMRSCIWSWFENEWLGNNLTAVDSLFPGNEGNPWR